MRMKGRATYRQQIAEPPTSFIPSRLWLLRSRALRNLDWPLLVKHLWALRRALAGCVSATRYALSHFPPTLLARANLHPMWQGSQACAFGRFEHA